MNIKVIHSLITILILFGISTYHLQANNPDRRPEFRIPIQPFIGINYGLSNLSLRDFDHTLTDPGLLEIRLGIFDLRFLGQPPNIIDYLSHNFSLAYYSTDIGPNSDDNDFESSLWKFGLMTQTGYGYRLSPVRMAPSIILTYASGFAWSSVSFDSPVADEEIPTERFEDALRFGNFTEASVQANLSGMLALNASFERSIIYERHLFWKWAGSVIIERIAQSLVGRFVDRILETSPSAVPVVNFLLRNGLAYGIYELRKSDMNWPFDTAAPLHYDTFKIGMSIKF